MSYNKYLPPLSLLFNLNKIPNELGFIKTELNNKLSQLHFRDLNTVVDQVTKEQIINLTVVSKSKIGFEIPGVSGLELVVNPNHTTGGTSDFPITINYLWKIQQRLNNFDFENFSFSTSEIIDLLLVITNLSEEKIIKAVIDQFFLDEDVSDPITEFINYVNSTLTPTSNLVLGSFPSEIEIIEDLLSQLQQGGNNYTLTDIFASCLLLADDTLGTISKKIDGIAYSLFGTTSIEDYILDIIIPKIRLSIDALTVGLVFPETWLKPVDSAYSKSILEYNAGSLVFDSEKGIDFIGTDTFGLNTPSQIGNTPLTIDIKNAKFDLRTDRNISEANEDGRPNTFKGFYVEDAYIGFPNVFEEPTDPSGNSLNTIKLVTKNMLIGSEGGISGTIGIDTDLNSGDSEQRLAFEVSSTSNFVLESGGIKISGTKRVSDNSAQGYALENKSITLTLPASGNLLYVLDSENNYYSVNSSGLVTPATSPNALFQFTIGDTSINVNDFYITFHQNSIVSSTISGTIDAPSLDDPLDMEISFADGFKIHVSDPDGLDVIDNTLLTLTLSDLELGQANDKLYLSLQGKLKNKLALPLIDKFVPETIDIQNLLWTEGEGVDYDVDLIWKNGLNIGISNDGPPEFSGFEKTIPINKSKEKHFFNLQSLKLSLKPDATNDGMDALILLQGAQFNFGKKKTVSFTIDGLGIKSHLSQPASGETNMGPFNVETSIVPPKGIGIAVDTKAVKGSGYLYLDIDNGEYIGQVQLSLKGKKPIDITAIGILNTKMPDGSKGFSFITIISATKLNIDLGGGFELDGLGGMLGIHRTMDTQFLRDNIKSGAIDNVLFPENIETNLTGIISDMKSIYPIKRDQFLFGPIAKVTYGKEIPIMDLDVGFAIEFSDPTRLLLIADVGIKIAKKLLEINVAAVGEVNFTKKRIMFDASIYNSKLAGLTLQGDMAFRLFWGKGEKGFLLSVGGFHPDFTPPQHLLVNDMNRLSIIVSKKKNLSIFVEAYFALTSNTLQFGALAVFKAKAGKLKVEAQFGLDTLFQFNPFRFSIAILAYAAIKWGSKSLMSVKFKGKLTGTEPWNVNGKVSFKILWVKITGRIDKTWGTNADSALPSIDLIPLIKTELESPKSWIGELPTTHYKLVSFDKPIDAEMIMIHPMGTLSVEQSKVPLGVTIEHFENQKISGSKQFNLSNVSIEGSTISNTSALNGDFAPAQYYKLSDKDKLSRASFEALKSGVKVKANSDLTMNYFAPCTANYDLTMYDWEAAEDLDPIYNIHTLFNHYRFVRGGSLSRSILSKRKRADRERIQDKSVSLSTDRYVVVDRDLNYPGNDSVTYTTSSRSEAMSLLNSLVSNDPDLDGELNIMSEIELL